MLSLFVQLLPAEFFNQIQLLQKRQNNRVYTTAVVIWLMIEQRLHSHATMETAVLTLLRSMPADFWPRPCKRLVRQSEPQAQKLSSNTGAYNQARQAMSLTTVEQSCDHVFQQLTEQATGRLAEVEQRAFFFDGTAVRLPNNEALCAAYPLGSNQFSESHWPLIRMLVAHDLYTGLAMRPEWGPMHGSQAVSEQGLLDVSIERLPSGAVIVGDANFGVFSVVYAADQCGHPVAVRLTMSRAKRLAGGQPFQHGIDRPIEWRPSRDDRKSHPQTPVDASVAGRLIVWEVTPSHGQPFLLALFTTLKCSPEKVVELYGYRWNIETDLRSLKGTLNLDQLTCTSTEMVAKEINLAIMAYNLVRAITYQAAQKVGLTPREFSFTRVSNVVNAYAPLIAVADEQHSKKLIDDMMYYVGQAKLPRRKKERSSYPRAVWGKPGKYPKRKS